MKLLKVLLLSPLCLFFNQHSTLAQNVDPKGLTTLDISDGLTSKTVTDIFADDDGFLWIATDDGLNRYDGTHMKQFFHEDKDHTLPSNIVTCIKPHGRDSILLGTSHGLAVYNKKTNQFSTLFYHDNSGLNDYDNKIMRMVQDKKGNFWVGGASSLFKYSSDLQLLRVVRSDFKTSDVGRKRISFVYSMVPLDDGDMYFILNTGTYIYDAADDELVDIGNSKKYKLDRLIGKLYWEIFPAGDHALFYFNHRVDSIYYFNYRTNSVTSAYFPYNDRPYNIWARCISQLSDSVFAFNDQVSGHGYINLSSGGIKVSPVLLHTDYQVGKMVRDLQGNRWMINLQGGLIQRSCNRTLFDELALVEGNDESKPYLTNAVLRVEDDLFVSRMGDGIRILGHDGVLKGQLRLTQTSADIWSNHIKQIWPYSKNMLWLVSLNGIFWLDPMTLDYGKITDRFNLPDICNEIPFVKIVDGEDDWVWLLGGMPMYQEQTTLVRFNKHTGKHQTIRTNDSEGYHFRYAIDAAQDPDGSWWFVSDASGDLLKWDEEQNHTEVIELPWDEINLHDDLTSIHIDSDGIIWLGTVNSGLLRFNTDQYILTVFGRERGILHSSVDDIYEDDQNTLWISSPNGLASFDKNAQVFRNYGKSDGLNFDHLSCDFYFDAADKMLYTGSEKGLVRFHPAAILNQPLPKTKVVLTELAVNGRVRHHDVDHQLVLRNKENHFSVAFAAIDFDNDRDNKFFYQLNGGNDSTWLSIGDQRTLFFDNLRPGEYGLKVRAVNKNGQINSNTVHMTFTILPHFTQTMWFFPLLSVVLAIAFYGIYRYNINRFKELEKIRFDISRDLHDQVGANLTNISYLSLLGQRVDDNQPSRSELFSRIHEDSYKVSEALKEIVWNINPENDSLSNALPRMLRYATELLEIRNIRVRADIPDEIDHLQMDMEQRRDLFLIFKEAINNLAKHSEADEASITFEIFEEELRMKISDNGRGFDRTATFAGNGVRNIQNRVAKNKWKLFYDSEKERGTVILLQARIA